MKEDKTDGGRPTVVSIVSVVIFLLGFVGLLLGIIAGVGVLLLPVDLPAFYIFGIMFWFVAGPCLILAGYYLWKMKKWAVKLAAIIILFDLITTPLIRLLLSLGVDTMDILAWALDVITLVLIGLAWKHLQQ